MSTEQTAETEVLREFDVTITETLQMKVTVEAYDRAHAEEIAEENWNNSDYILGAEQFVGAAFDASDDGREITRDVEPREEGGTHAMNETTSVAYDTPLDKNPYVQELFSILGDHGKDTSGLSALLGHVSEMESFVKRAEDKIADMKSQLAEIKEVQGHPFKAALQNAINTLELKVAEVKERIGELKTAIVESCKNAVTAFKENGVKALGNLASFFKIKPALEAVKKANEAAIRSDVKAIKSIESFSEQYHSAGRALKNMGRLLVGKEPLDAKKEAGKLAKAISAPYRAEKAILININGSIKDVIAKLEQLDHGVQAKKAERAAAPKKKPSMLKKLDENRERVAQAKREIPTPERKVQVEV